MPDRPCKRTNCSDTCHIKTPPQTGNIRFRYHEQTCRIGSLVPQAELNLGSSLLSKHQAREVGLGLVHGSLVVCFAFQMRIGRCSSGRVHVRHREQGLRHAMFTLQEASRAMHRALHRGLPDPSEAQQIGLRFVCPWLWWSFHRHNAKVRSSQQVYALQACCPILGFKNVNDLAKTRFSFEQRACTSP